MTSPFSQRSRIPPDPPDHAPALPGAPQFDLASTDTTGWSGWESLELSALEALVRPEATRHLPDSCGLLDARASLARFQEPRDPSRWILTASSSESYSLLFQLLCDPGDRVGSVRPGYPLVEELGRFQMVSSASIPLRWQDRSWHLDLGWTEKRLKEGIRALVIVQPSNPTGWILSPAERLAILDLCSRYRVPLVSDEVFEAWAPPQFQSLATQNQVLCFTLGGLSKLLGLPHLKLGWIRLSGPADEVLEARGRLEVLNDALLSASTPVQCALPHLLDRRDEFQRRIHERLLANRAAWRSFGSKLPSRFEAQEQDSGWFGVLLCNGCVDEALLCKALDAHGVRVLSGYLFDLPKPGLVVSLISHPDQLAHGLSVLLNLLISLELEQ